MENKKYCPLKIAPAAVDPEDVEALEDLILAAVNEANRKAKEVAEKKIRCCHRKLETSWNARYVLI